MENKSRNHFFIKLQKKWMWQQEKFICIQKVYFWIRAVLFCYFMMDTQFPYVRSIRMKKGFIFIWREGNVGMGILFGAKDVMDVVYYSARRIVDVFKSFFTFNMRFTKYGMCLCMPYP